MSRADSVGMFWQDEERQNKGVPKQPSTAHLTAVPEGGLGFEPSVLPPSKQVPEYIPTIPQAIMDIECYPNYFLVMFMRLNDDKVIAFERTGEVELDRAAISGIFRKYEMITFNGNNFDIPLLRYALTGATNEELKEATVDIIVNDMGPYQFEKKYKQWPVPLNHIDLIEVAPGMVSLKTYGARLHVEELQDLPIEPDTVLTLEQKLEIGIYCQKDLRATKRLFLDLLPQIELRRTMSKQYHCDLRSKSDAQIAEEVIKGEIVKATGQRPPKPVIEAREFYYQLPSFIRSNNIQIRNAMEIVTTEPFTIHKNGRIEMPRRLRELKLKINQSVYQMGMGGLHSTEEAAHHFEAEDRIIADWDVASYYPSIILNCKLAPKQLGDHFLTCYQSIVTERLQAKRDGDKVKADSLKITINGSFGKLGSPYSFLYAPELMVQVTVTGQLSLLMLIWMMEDNGIQVVSANTDGIVLSCPREKESLMVELVEKWQESTGFEMEREDYKALFSRNVNNYIAVKKNGSVKTKGCFAPASISKNPQNEICNLALIEFLKSGKPFIETIQECTDVTKFLAVRKVNGGAVKDKQYLGKVARWYWARGGKGTINYKNNGHSVPCTEGARPLMDLPPEFPSDIDYGRYEKECHNLLRDLGLKIK